MQVFQVRHDATGAILWTGEATGEFQALDAMAHAAGYRDQSHMPDTIQRSGLSVEALNFGVSSARVATPMMQGGNLGRIADRGGSMIPGGAAGIARNG